MHTCDYHDIARTDSHYKADREPADGVWWIHKGSHDLCFCVNLLDLSHFLVKPCGRVIASVHFLNGM